MKTENELANRLVSEIITWCGTITVSINLHTIRYSVLFIIFHKLSVSRRDWLDQVCVVVCDF